MMQNILVLGKENAVKPSGGLGVHIQEVYSRMTEKNITYVGFAVYDEEIGIYKYSEIEGKKSWDRIDFKDYDGNGFFAFILPSGSDFMCEDLRVSHMVTNEITISYLLKIFKVWKPEIIHVHDFHLFRAAAMMRSAYKIPVYMTLHLSQCIWHWEYAFTDEDRFLLQQEVNAIQQADKLITVSAYYKDKLDEMHYRGGDVKVIRNGVDTEVYKKIANYNPIQKVVGFVGRLTPQKGLHLLYKSFRKLKGVKFKLIVNVYMEGKPTPYIEEFQHMVSQCPNVEVFYNISQEEKLKIMEECSVGIVPSEHESAGIVPSEWMSMGIPVIVSNIPPFKEYCTVDNSDIVDLDAKKWLKVLKKFKYDKAKVRKAEKTAKTMSWLHGVKQLTEEYDNE